MFDFARCESLLTRLLSHDGGDLASIEQLAGEVSWRGDCDSTAELSVDDALVDKYLLAFKCLDLFHATPNKR